MSTLYRGGVVHSPADPFAEAVLVADGVVAWLGPQDAADRLVEQVDEVVDLAGALVTPAFVDSHSHLALTALADVRVDLAGLDRAQVLAAVAAAPGPAVLGVGWQLAPGAEPITPGELDRAAAGRRVVLVDDALAGGLAGPGPLAGPLTGLALGAALAELSGSFGDVERALHAVAGAGVVAVHEQSLPALESRRALADLIARTAVDPDVPLVVGYRAELCETADDARAIAADIPGLTGIGGHLSVDGALAGWAAALRVPYVDAPGHAGDLLLSAEQVANHVAAVTRAHLQAGLEVHGDRAMDEVLLGLRAAADVEGTAALHRAGHRLEGVDLVDAPALAAMVLLGLRASVAPTALDAVSGSRLGPLRLEALLPLADLAAAGVPLAFGSAGSRVDPWAAVRAAVLHPDPQQRISARAAFRAHTRGGWRLAGLDHTGAGEIRVGAPAHLAVWRAESLVVQAPEGRLAAWSTDPRAGTPVLPELGPDLAPPVCVRTLRAGTVIHDTLA